MQISSVLILIFVGFIISNKIGSGETVTVTKKAFTFESDIRTINIVFDTADCQISTTYKCSSISKEHKKVDINCTYKQLNDSILIIKNKLYNPKLKPIDLTPPKEELEKCLSRNITNHKNKNKVNSWSNDNGFIPAIGIDTIKVFSKSNKLFLFIGKRRGTTIYNFLLKEKH